MTSISNNIVCLLCAASVVVYILPSWGDAASWMPSTTTPKRNETTATSSSCPLEPCNISMVLVGDSLTRFQYFSLVYFLRHGQWLDPQASPNLIHPSTLMGGAEESTYEWTPWFQASTNALAPFEKCDCYREPTAISGGDWMTEVLPYICENRYYYDPVRQNRVTYIQAYGNATTLHGHWTGHQEKAWGPLTRRIPYLWEGDWMDAIRSHIAALNPEVLVFNAGIWDHSFGSASFRAAFMEALRDTATTGRRVIWKTTTAGNYGDYTQQASDAAMCDLLQDCLNVTWTTTVPQSLYVDYFHFLEPVYRLLNEQLLAHLSISIPPIMSSTSGDVIWYPTSIPGLVAPTTRARMRDHSNTDQRRQY